MTAPETTAWIAVVVALDGCVALVGGLMPDRVLARWRSAMIGFAAGMLLVSGATEVLPEAIAHVGFVAVAWAVGACGALYVFARLTSRRDSHGPVRPVALLTSDAFHNFGDGMAIAAAFLVSPRLGAYTSLAVIAHELPEELADYALLRAAGVRRGRALASLALVQLTAGLGAATTLVATDAVAALDGIILAVASGMFVYLGAHDLLPEVVRTPDRRAWLGLGAGAIVAWLGA